MKLFRISTFLTLVIATVFGVLLFWTSQDVQKQERILGKAKAELSQERETIRVLSVEWDYLNRPQRLEELALELGMQMPDAKEVMVGISQIPEPAAEPAVNEIAIMQEAVTHSVALTAEPEAAPAFVYPDYPKYVAPISVTPVSTTAQAQVAKAIPVKAEILSPPAAEKQSFDRLIQSLDQESAY